MLSVLQRDRAVLMSPCATRSAMRLPVPCSVLGAEGESSWWALIWKRVSLLWFDIMCLKRRPVSV